MTGHGQETDFKQEAHTKLITHTGSEPSWISNSRKEKFTVERKPRLEKVNTTDVNTSDPMFSG